MKSERCSFIFLERSVVDQSNDKPGHKNTTERTCSTQQSLIQQQYNVEESMNTVLSMPVTILIGKFIIYSVELRKQLMQELQNHIMNFMNKEKIDIAIQMCPK